MDYRSQLQLLSESILDFDSKESNLEEIIEASSIHRLTIYRKNYFYLSYEILTGDFPATFKYIGDNNFRFLVKKFLNNEGISSPCIFDLPVGFQKFLLEGNEIHNDDLLDEISAIDLMWSHGLSDKIEVSSGMLEYWQGLMTGKESQKIINLEKPVKLRLIDDQGEQAIKVES